MSHPSGIVGADAIRGRANLKPVDTETALLLGKAAGQVFKHQAPEARDRLRHTIVLGKDTRLSGYLLEQALASGILSVGVDVLFVGPLPTPGIAYVTRSLRADAGIVITASHRPYEENGFKFFRADGYPLDDAVQAQIEDLVFSGAVAKFRPAANEIGKAVRIDDALGRYIEYAKATVPRGWTLEGTKVVVDCAHGAAYKSTPCVLRELGAEIVVLNHQPDGLNINRDCGCLHPEALCQKVRDCQAHLGVIHDGDADRVLLCDEAGRLVDGDDILVMVGLDRLVTGELPHRTLVATEASHPRLEAALAPAGGRIVRLAAGDRRIIHEMRRNGYLLGGDPQGHVIFGSLGTTGDGLVAALQVLRLMKTRRRPLSELAHGWK
jgi:phosphoglucosamine mutase